jgi:hypothetical protein
LRISSLLRPGRDCHVESRAALRTLKNPFDPAELDEAYSPSAVHVSGTPKCENESTSNVMTSQRR